MRQRHLIRHGSGSGHRRLTTVLEFRPLRSEVNIVFVYIIAGFDLFEVFHLAGGYLCVCLTNGIKHARQCVESDTDPYVLSERHRRTDRDNEDPRSLCEVKRVHKNGVPEVNAVPGVQYVLQVADAILLQPHSYF